MICNDVLSVNFLNMSCNIILLILSLIYKYDGVHCRNTSKWNFAAVVFSCLTNVNNIFAQNDTNFYESTCMTKTLFWSCPRILKIKRFTETFHLYVMDCTQYKPSLHVKGYTTTHIISWFSWSIDKNISQYFRLA